MRKTVTVLSLLLLLTGSALALEIPTAATVQNLNGSQQYIKTYTVSPDTDPQVLIEEPFTYESDTYTYASIVKEEHRVDEAKPHRSTVTIETPTNNLSTVLENLAPTIDYSDGTYSGTLALDHTTISTRAAGYVGKSYTVNATKEISDLNSNDMSYVPATTVKDGVTLNLTTVDWQVQGSALVDDVLVPSQYKAVATYSGRASHRVATGYVTTADYVGEISRSAVDSVTYTVTYLGTENVPESNSSAGIPSMSATPWIVGGGGLALAIVLSTLLLVSRGQIQSLKKSMVAQTAVYEETEEIPE